MRPRNHDVAAGKGFKSTNQIPVVGPSRLYCFDISKQLYKLWSKFCLALWFRQRWHNHSKVVGEVISRIIQELSQVLFILRDYNVSAGCHDLQIGAFHVDPDFRGPFAQHVSLLSASALRLRRLSPILTGFDSWGSGRGACQLAIIIGS